MGDFAFWLFFVFVLFIFISAFLEKRKNENEDAF